MVLADAGSRRRAWLSGGLPVPQARTGCFFLFRSPACPPAPGDRLRSPAERGGRWERQRLSTGGWPRSGTLGESPSLPSPPPAWPALCPGTQP
ncbi:hypothetical protein HVPorG_04983 [Roseomonas mucosa]|nr:hypothetical protein HVPorG_04983 [Roseomonas mucosa]